MADCKRCEYSVFDEKFGEYKCKKRQTRIYDREKYKHCELYKPKSKKKSS